MAIIKFERKVTQLNRGDNFKPSPIYRKTEIEVEDNTIPLPPKKPWKMPVLLQVAVLPVTLTFYMWGYFLRGDE